MVVLILAFLAAPGRCSAAAELRVGLGMATRHPGVWRWRVETCCRAQEINATTCHTGCRQTLGDGTSLFLQQRSVSYISGGDLHMRLIAKGGVEPPGGMAGREAIVQLLAALMAEAPERFPLEQHAFVGELLLSAAAVDRTSSDLLVAGLAAAVRRPLRPRAFGEPCPEDVAIVAEAQQLHDHLPPGHPARRLYATLRDQAHAAIATAQEADRALLEG